MKQLVTILQLGCAICALALLAITKFNGDGDWYAHDFVFAWAALTLLRAAIWGIK